MESVPPMNQQEFQFVDFQPQPHSLFDNGPIDPLALARRIVREETEAIPREDLSPEPKCPRVNLGRRAEAGLGEAKRAPRMPRLTLNSRRDDAARYIVWGMSPKDAMLKAGYRPENARKYNKLDDVLENAGFRAAINREYWRLRILESPTDEELRIVEAWKIRFNGGLVLDAF
jgi:hypothetical protein